jgi:hypothetical protein
MAKLSARGCYVVARYRKGDMIFAIRSDGAILSRWNRTGEGWKLYLRCGSVGAARAVADRLGWEEWHGYGSGVEVLERFGLREAGGA